MFTMKMETARFNRNVKELAKKYPDKADLIIKKFAVDLLTRTILKNPVKTGRSRAGWYLSMRGLGVTNIDLSSRPGPAGRSPESKSEVSKGKKEGRYRENLRGTNRWVEIINSVKYILGLEYGRSAQSPEGMLRISMRELTGDKLPRDLGRELKKQWYRSVRYER